MVIIIQSSNKIREIRLICGHHYSLQTKLEGFCWSAVIIILSSNIFREIRLLCSHRYTVFKLREIGPVFARHCTILRQIGPVFARHCTVLTQWHSVSLEATAYVNPTRREVTPLKIYIHFRKHMITIQFSSIFN